MSGRARALGKVALVHAVLFLSLWMVAVLVYAVTFASALEPVWLVVDGVLAAGGFAFVYLQRTTLGFAALGARRGIKLAAICVFGIACVLASQLLIHDWNMVSIDERNYLMTVHAEGIVVDGRIPYNIRWLVPLIAGRWNIFPVGDMDAVKALNFGALVVTAVSLVLLLVRLRVPLRFAWAAPVFLLCSYLGIYGASNRLVLDAANYALFVLLFHTLLRRDHWPLFAAVLLVNALNAEKAVYWLPVFVLVTLFRYERPWSKRDLLAVAKVSLFALGPTVLYFLVLSRVLKSSSLEANLCFENLNIMAFSPMRGRITESVRLNTFQTLWVPFGPFTVYALLGFATYSKRYLKPILLLLLPIFVQALIACDTDRMLAYSFIVYLPFGYLYLARAFTELPKGLAYPLFGLAIVLAIVQHYMFPVLEQHDYVLIKMEKVKMALSALEILLVGTIVFVHASFYRRGDV